MSLQSRRRQEYSRRLMRTWAAGAGGRTGLPVPTGPIRQRGVQQPSLLVQRVAPDSPASAGYLMHLARETNQEFSDTGGLLELNIERQRVGFPPPTLPATSQPAAVGGVWSVVVSMEGTWPEGSTVQVLRGGSNVLPPLTLDRACTSVEGVVPLDLGVGDTPTVRVTAPSGGTVTVERAEWALRMEGPEAAAAAPPTVGPPMADLTHWYTMRTLEDGGWSEDDPYGTDTSGERSDWLPNLADDAEVKTRWLRAATGSGVSPPTYQVDSGRPGSRHTARSPSRLARTDASASVGVPFTMSILGRIANLPPGSREYRWGGLRFGNSTRWMGVDQFGRYRVWAQYADSEDATLTAADTAEHLLQWVALGAGQHALYVDGAKVHETSFADPDIASELGVGGVHRQLNEPGWWENMDGWWREALIHQATSTGALRQEIAEYLAAEWGVPSILDGF